MTSDALQSGSGPAGPDLQGLCLQAASGPVALRPKSLDVLGYLVENAGRIVGKDELMRAVWPDVTVSDESLTQCISEVRRAIGDENKQLIRTIPKRGYMADGRLSVNGAEVVATLIASSNGRGVASPLDARQDEPGPATGQIAGLREPQRFRQSWRASRAMTLGAAVVVGITLAGAVGAFLILSRSSRDGAWQGAMTCDKLPFTNRPLIASMAVNLSGGSASYSRYVFSPDGAVVVGVEQGAGSIDSIGAIKLTGGWASEPNIGFTSSYSGLLHGRTAELYGTQVFRFEGKDFTRNCSIRLSR